MKKGKYLVLVSFCLLLITVSVGCGASENVIIVDDLIINIGTVSLDTEDSIIDAEQAYDSLSVWDKMHVGNHQKLLEARETYNRIKDVSNLIQGLEAVTIDSEEDIIKAESAYEALSSEERQAIQNYDLLIEAKNCYESLVRIDRVEKAIAATKEIDAEKIKSKDDIALYIEAKKLYDALNDTEKSGVQNYNVLTDVEAMIPIGWTLPVLSEKDYWEFIDTTIREVFRKQNLFIIRIDSRMPYCNYYIEPGRLLDDNTYQPIGLQKDDYEALISEMKESLHQLLNQYSIDYGDGFFSRPNRDIVGLHFYNRFNNSVFGKGACLGVADYQVDLLSYYYHHWSEDYIRMDSFDDYYWTVSEVYTP